MSAGKSVRCLDLVVLRRDSAFDSHVWIGGIIMQKAKWTFMLYLAGDNNLSDAGDADLAEIRAIGSTRDVNIVAQFDNAGSAGTRRFLIQKDGLNEAVDDRGETNSGSPEMLTDFVNWATVSYPAHRYALVLWNHGSGWEPSEVDRIARSVGSRDYNARELNERSSSKLGRVLFRTTLEKVFKIDTPNERAICSDDGSGHSLDTVEFGNVLNQVVGRLDGPIDVLGMDACLMSNFEVAYQARRYAKFVVASEEVEPNQGWPYTPILDWLTKNPDASSADFAAGIVREYVASYERMKYRGPVTQSALNSVPSRRCRQEVERSGGCPRAENVRRLSIDVDGTAQIEKLLGLHVVGHQTV